MVSINNREDGAMTALDRQDLAEGIAKAHREMQAFLGTSERESREHAVRAFNHLASVVAVLLDES